VDVEGGWSRGDQETKGYLRFSAFHEVMIGCIDGVRVALKVFEQAL